MAASGSLQHIFEKSLTEKPTLLESLSPWNKIKPVIEMFGELNFKKYSLASSATTPFPLSSSLSLSSSSFSTSFHDLNQQNTDELDANKKTPSSSPVSFAVASTPKGYHAKSDGFSSNPETKAHSFNYIGDHKNCDSFSSMNSETLQLCTEGLGFESFDDVEELKNEDWQNQQDKVSTLLTKHSQSQTENLCGEFRRSRTSSGGFPPPISCIRQSGKPWFSFKSYRHDGRFVLKETRIPSQEFLHACREDGRLKLQFVQPNDDILELEEEEQEDYQEDEDEFEVDEEQENGSISDVEEEKMEAYTKNVTQEMTCNS